MDEGYGERHPEAWNNIKGDLKKECLVNKDT